MVLAYDPIIVPEPLSALLFTVAWVALAGWRRRRSRGRGGRICDAISVARVP